MADVLPTVFARVPALSERFEEWRARASGRDVLAAGAVAQPHLGKLPVEGRRPGGLALQEGRWKLIAAGGSEQLYDLEADPHELEDRSGQRPELDARLRERLEELRAEQVARGRALGAGVLRAADPDRRRGLEELGYGGAEESDEAVEDERR
jgi:arylsulfatase A-like enzyme